MGEIVKTDKCNVGDPCKCMYNGHEVWGIEKECVGCHLEWCTEQPALNLVQFIIGLVILSLGRPFRIALTQSIYTKVIGPIPQVI